MPATIATDKLQLFEHRMSVKIKSFVFDIVDRNNEIGRPRRERVDNTSDCCRAYIHEMKNCTRPIMKEASDSNRR